MANVVQHAKVSDEQPLEPETDKDATKGPGLGATLTDVVKRSRGMKIIGYPVPIFDDLFAVPWKSVEFFAKYGCAMFSGWQIAYVRDEKRAMYHLLICKKLVGVSKGPTPSTRSSHGFSDFEMDDLDDAWPTMVGVLEEVKTFGGNRELIPSLAADKETGHLWNPKVEEYWSGPNVTFTVPSGKFRFRTSRWKTAQAGGKFGEFNYTKI